MADSIVSAFLDRLGPLIVKEAVFIRGVEDQLKLLRDELEWIRSFLREAQHRRRESHLIEVWVTQIIDLAYDAEDVVDAYILHVELQRRRNLITKIMSSGKIVYSLHQLGNRIEQINTRAQRISACRINYDLDVSKSVEGSVSEATEDMVYRRRGIPTLVESDVVGFKEERNLLAGQLIDGDAFKSRRVISILGMGGLGKTTLARVIFNNMSNHFKARIWITVSQKYDARDLLLTALKQLVGESGDSAKMGYEQVKEDLYKYLESQRYLVVIDDIWKVGTWERISLAFPNNEQGSRIILTTRNEEVALHSVTSRNHFLELRLLDKVERWVLFCRKVFSVSGSACPDHLTKVGREIVEKCGGLPLAIVVIGGLLMGKERTVSAWSKVRDSAKWQLSQDSSLCRETLLLSYNDLPHYLKSCFLYLGLFPEDYVIKAERLILLWVSEGFVKARGEENMEDVAEDYLEELIQRSMIQVAKRMYLEGPVLSCRIHDLWRDLAVSESRKDNFMDFRTSNNCHSLSSHGNLRRFAIHPTTGGENEDQFYGTVITTSPSLRSLFLFQSNEVHLKQPISISFHDTKMLRVLDIDFVDLGRTFPKEIGKLFFLQYLRVKSRKLRILPNSIGKLVNLQTLDLQHSGLRTLPKTIWKLKNLRHLHLSGDCLISQHIGELCQLNGFGSSLLTLTVSHDTLMKIAGVPAKLRSLRSLCLIDMVINNNSGGFPLNLAHLTLYSPDLTEDPLVVFRSLPRLKSLIIDSGVYFRNANCKMIFSREEFSQLEFLRLDSINFIEWRVEDGALPSLRDVKIKWCASLKKLPDGMKYITSLQRITIKYMPQAFVDRVREDGEDWEIIKHVPTIDIVTRDLET